MRKSFTIIFAITLTMLACRLDASHISPVYYQNTAQAIINNINSESDRFVRALRGFLEKSSSKTESQTEIIEALREYRAILETAYDRISQSICLAKTSVSFDTCTKKKIVNMIRALAARCAFQDCCCALRNLTLFFRVGHSMGTYSFLLKAMKILFIERSKKLSKNIKTSSAALEFLRQQLRELYKKEDDFVTLLRNRKMLGGKIRILSRL